MAYQIGLSSGLSWQFTYLSYSEKCRVQAYELWNSRI